MVINYDDNVDVLNFLNSNPNFDLLNNNSFFESFNDLMPDCKYESIDSLDNNLSNEKLFCVSMNCQSLRAKYVAITNLIDSMKIKSINPCLINCQEIWKTDSFPCNISGFNFFSKSRSQGQGGGVGIYVRDDIHAEQLNKESLFIDNIYESIAIKIDIPKVKKFIAVSLYRPNHHNDLSYSNQLEQFFIHLTNHLSSLKKQPLPVYFFTDSNIDLLKYDNDVNSTHFNDLLSNFGFYHIISKATRIYGESHTLIDHVFTSDNCNQIHNSGVIIDGVSDHFHPFVTINQKKLLNKNNNLRQFRNFSVSNKDSFKALLQQESWSNVLESNDPNESANLFINTFLDKFHSSFPLQYEKVNRRYKPINKFMTPGLLKSRRTKLKLANKAKLNPSFQNKRKYTIYRNAYNSAIKKSKKLTFNADIEATNGNSKKVWNVINENLNKSSKKNNVVGPILIDGELITDEKIMADKFNVHFANVGKKVVNDIPESSTHFTDYLPPPANNSFFMGPVTPLDIMYYILTTKKKKSQDINEISTDLLHHVAIPVAVPLSHIFNLSIVNGIFPDAFKLSKIIPIFKSSDMKDMDNYRGVSITDIFSKIFERIVNTRLTNFLVNNDFFYTHQFGFLKNKSTNHAVLDFINFISDNLNKGNVLLGLFMDVRKCFDCISHSILFKKLENAGIRGNALKWFKSFFNGRKQKVKIGNEFSNNTCEIDISTFQGSVLGVLTFLIFINDVHYCTNAFSVLFADDIQALTVGRTLDEVMITANIELDKLCNWYKANKLSIHPDKSHFMIFSSNRNILASTPIFNDEYYLPLFLNNNPPGECDISKISLIKMIPNNENKSIRMLGVLLDKNLNFSEHCKYIHGKISRSLFSLNQVKNILNKDCMKLVFQAHVQSHLEYCSNILCMAPEKYLKPLKIVQKKAIRLVCGADYHDHTSPLFKEENILPLAQLIDYNIIKFVLDYKLNRLPDAFSNLWIENQYRGGYILRNAEDFYIPHVRCISFFKHPLYHFPRVWNELPERLKNVTNRTTFLNDLKDYLLSEL